MSNSTYFSPNQIARVVYINPPNAESRRAHIEHMAAELGISGLERVPNAVHYSQFGDAQRSDALARTKVDLHYNGAEWVGLGPETNFNDIVLPPAEAVEIPDSIARLALGKSACQLSHLRAIEYVLATLLPEDENKWVILLEDDALLDLLDREAINRAFADPPGDAGAIMLTGCHAIDRAALPITPSAEAQEAGLAIPTAGFMATAIAYHPAMLRAIVDVYRTNLQMSREGGGVSPVDVVNCLIQSVLVGVPPYRNEPEYVTLAREFERASNGLAQNRFYILNPSRVRESGDQSLVGSSHTTEAFRYGKHLRTFPRETVLRIHGIFESVLDPSARATIVRILEGACVEGSGLSESELLTAITNAAGQGRTAYYDGRSTRLSESAEYLLSTGMLVEREGRLYNAFSGDWYVPLEERRGPIGAEYLRYVRGGPRNWSAAVGAYSPNYDDGESLPQVYFRADSGRGGHAWLTLLAPDGSSIATEANLSPGKVLDSFVSDLRLRRGYRNLIKRVSNRCKQVFGRAERTIDGRDNGLRLPHSIIEVFISERAARAIATDIAAYEWMAGQGNLLPAARFNGINLGGRNCAAYPTTILERVGLDFKGLVGVKATSLGDAYSPLIGPSIHRAAYRAAKATDGARLPPMPGARPCEMSIHPFDFARGYHGNIYVLNVDVKPRPKGSLGDVLRHARSLGFVTFQQGKLVSSIPDRIQRVPAEQERRKPSLLVRFGASHSHLITEATIRRTRLSWRR
jgi:hypothetical protein